MFAHALLVIATVAMVKGQAYTHDPDNTWSYQWYPDESFHMFCNNSRLIVMDTDNVTWETPGKLLIDTDNYADANYNVSAMRGVPRVDLLIKQLNDETNGVYICRVYNKENGTMRARTILAVNLKGHKYHKMFDKYRHNLIVAVIATAVFAVPFLGICLTYQFRYKTDADQGGEYPNDIARSTRSKEGNGSYEQNVEVINMAKM